MKMQIIILSQRKKKRDIGKETKEKMRKENGKEKKEMNQKKQNMDALRFTLFKKRKSNG